MLTANDACEAMTKWWRGLRVGPTESISVPFSQDVVRQFLQGEPTLQTHEPALREWARGHAWVISSARWKAVRQHSL